MSISSEKVKKWRHNTKEKIIIAMGSSCQICHYNKCNEVLELHHLDPTIKEFGFGAIRANPKSWEKITEELQKCILLCANCHREVHYGISIIPVDYQKFDESLLQNITKDIVYKMPLLSKELSYCPICNNQKLNHNKYCSYTCAAKSKKHSKFNWDDIDLIDMIEVKKMTKTYIADQIGCSDAAVHKRYKKLKSQQNQ